ncbi:hypothetical protein ABDD95_23830 (plasmid) [Mucilaginibacter sp. PAMB04274]|uniref:hypothetical protein n=1 Tax=Mucilaginibacter sp. PAMB04274 TaxID=3138568 RepID=UPI0031F690A7
MDVESKTPYRVKIEYTKYEWLKNLALKNLGINNINQLRDRFEGQVYFNNFLVRSYGEIALERFLGSSIIDLGRKENQRNYVPNIKVNSKTLNIIAFTFGENPKILKGDLDIAVFIMVNLENRTCDILGFLHYDKLAQFVDSKLLSPLDETRYLGVFKTFEELLPINELSL